MEKYELEKVVFLVDGDVLSDRYASFADSGYRNADNVMDH